jgi:hypothetical protein
MTNRPLSDAILLKLNDALVNAGFSSLDLDRALKSDLLIEFSKRCDGPDLKTTIGLNPNEAFVSFNFGGIVKHGMCYSYPASDANDEEIANFIYDLIGAAATDEK